jgi:hypothetical protein
VPQADHDRAVLAPVEVPIPNDLPIVASSQVVPERVAVVQHAPVAADVQPPGVGVTQHGGATSDQVRRRVLLVPQRRRPPQQVDVLDDVLHRRAGAHHPRGYGLVGVQLAFPPAHQVHLVGEAVHQLHPLVGVRRMHRKPHVGIARNLVEQQQRVLRRPRGDLRNRADVGLRVGARKALELADRLDRRQKRPQVSKGHALSPRRGR